MVRGLVSFIFLFVASLSFCSTFGISQARSQDMEEMWGDQVVKLRADDAKKGQLFDQGNYAMFIHWGVYSQLANKVDGKTYYGIGEWIMHKNMAKIPVPKYKELAKTFNPVNFDAAEIVKTAKDAGMKYIIITAKHHDGFAMYHSKCNKFNIVDATPFARDPMKELAAECKKQGIGFGFYYSHKQDWTFPGGGGAPGKDEDGNRATFDDYFVKKCLPQVKEITSQYGPIELVWFDTPGNIPKEYVQQLVAVVRENQPNALVSGRAGHGLGDYKTLGDMEVPLERVEGMWESVDTTNDSWAYAYYDNYWKTPEVILERLVGCVGRGGTYMLNVGPRGDGVIPERAVKSLKKAGDWIRKYPQVVYAAQPSPWTHKFPWGDASAKDNSVFLSVFDWPRDGALYVPGLSTKPSSIKLLGDEPASLDFEVEGDWLKISVPYKAPEKLASVIQLDFAQPPQADSTWGLDPEHETEIETLFASVEGVEKNQQRWMEKYGEWKRVIRSHKWKEDGSGRATWEVSVVRPGDYNVELTYTGEGRVVWGVEIEGGEQIQNQQNSSHNYQKFPIGWINFPKPGKYRVSVSFLEGNAEKASLKSIHFKCLAD